MTLKNCIGCDIASFKMLWSSRNLEKEQKDDKPGEGLPKAKVNALNFVNSCINIPIFVLQVYLKPMNY